MTTYIYPHQNPKILTGQMAAYREPKPEYKDYEISWDKFDSKGWNKANNQHLESQIGYIKEPELTTGQYVYLNGDKNRKIKFVKMGKDEYTFKCGREYKSTISKNKYSWFSHYYPGQKKGRDDFKWVREVVLQDTDTQKDVKGSLQLVVINEWQEVKEPYTTINEGAGTESLKLIPNPEHTKFLKGTKSGLILLTEKKQ